MRVLNAMTPPRYARERADFRLSTITNSIVISRTRIPIGWTPTTGCSAQVLVSLKLDGYRHRHRDRIRPFRARAGKPESNRFGILLARGERPIDIASLLFFLGREIKRIALGATHFGPLFRLRLGDVARIDRNHARAPLVRRHHHL